MRFKDRVVIVTGAGSGIGRVMAQRFAAEGAKVAVVDWLGGRADAVTAEISDAGGKAVAIHSDVSSAAGVDSMLTSAVSQLGPVDVLVNNAAIADGDDVLQIDDATWDRDVAVVLKSVFLCSKAVLPSMIERGRGAIVNIASVNGLSALGNEAYSAAKAGVINLTQGIAVRYGAHGIRCNAIAPGTIRTPIWQERIDRDPVVFERLVKWYPLGRVGEPEDVANAALFLASDDASWITGTVLPVDGGLLAGNFRMTRELLAEAGSEELEPQS
jgi:meso-butanediol dehydrogenase / (S,S)-butanediol dehydrogenase / diacetyl reductase